MNRTQPHRQATILESLEAESRRQHPELHVRRPAPAPHRRLRWQDRTLLLVGIVLAALLLLRLETARAQTPPPASSTSPPSAGAEHWGLTLQADGAHWHQLALDTSMAIEVTGMLARVHVVQSFRNDGSDWMEGVYRFPLPDGAAVDQLYVKVGERILEGEVQEKAVATRTYQEARATGRTATLVRQERANQFSTQLANIGPGEAVHVMIGFLVNVRYEEGAFSLNLPTTFTRRYGSEPQPGTGTAAPRPQLVALESVPAHGFDLTIDLASGLPLAAVESLHHDVDILPVAGGYEVRLRDDLALTDRAFELRWVPEWHALPQSTLSTWTDGDAVYAQLMLLPPEDEALEPQDREVVLVIDTSGSMDGASIEQARAALHRALDELGPGDRFNLIQFNNVTEPLFAAPVAPTTAQLRAARHWIDGLQAEGGTEMEPALLEALRGEPAEGLMRQVVFVTDGSVGNEQQLLEIVGERLGDSRLFTVAIGAAPNGWFMRKAAEVGRGHHTKIGRLADVERTMTALWEQIRLPAISDLCIDWGTSAEYYPEIIPDLYAGSPLWVVARLDREPGLVSLCGELNGQPWHHAAAPQLETGSETLATLWARRKIEALQDGLVFGEDPDETREAVTRVALDHQLLTPYTSLVAVDRTPRRSVDSSLAMGNIPSILPAGSTGHSAGFPATATGWPVQLALAALVLSISTLLMLFPFARLPVLRRRPGPGQRSGAVAP